MGILKHEGRVSNMKSVIDDHSPGLDISNAWPWHEDSELRTNPLCHYVSRLQEVTNGELGPLEGHLMIILRLDFGVAFYSSILARKGDCDWCMLLRPFAA